LTAGTQYLADIADVGTTSDLPLAVASVVGCVREPTSYGVAELDDDRPLGASLRVRGKSGRWYALSASLAEPDAAAESAAVVIINPVERADMAPILARLYGLSPRECEVLALVARGEATRSIASRLGLSPYTVQDHLDHAFDKVGVRGRRALIAKLFFDGYARDLLPSRAVLVTTPRKG
jgi:DNA-binding HTH domain-containing proteins